MTSWCSGRSPIGRSRTNSCAVAAPTLPALFWWAQQRPGDHPARHALLVYVAALGPRACAHQSHIAATIAGWRYQLRSVAAQDALGAALRALCGAPDSCLEVLVCGYEPAQRFAIEHISTQPDLRDAAPRLEAIAVREADPRENPERARVRAMAAALALTRIDPPLRNLWVVLVRDGTLDEQRRVVRQLAARGARDRFLWESIAEHDDAAIRAIATAQLSALDK
jgi:hypothetical protein